MNTEKRARMGIGAMTPCPASGQIETGSREQKGPHALGAMDVAAEESSSQEAPPSGSWQNSNGRATQAPQKQRSPVAPLVLGILSLILPIVGLILGTIAIALGSAARKQYPAGSTENGMATAGWIMGIVGVIVGALLLTVLLVNLVWFVPLVSSTIGHEVADSIWFATNLIP